MGEVVDIQLV